MSKATFNYSTKEDRQNTVSTLFAAAKDGRANVDLLWQTYDNYYDGIHKTLSKIREELSAEELKEAMESCILTDAFIHIESQIDPGVPEAEFYGRDNLTDFRKAKERKYVTKYIADRNDLESKNTSNERRLRKYGDSIAKCYYDDFVINETGEQAGDIAIDFINNDDFFPDPTAVCLEDCEYVDYVIYMHKRKAQRVFEKELKENDIDIFDESTDSKTLTQNVSAGENSVDKSQHQVQIIEHWYKDDEGDIACSIQLNGKEIKWIEKFWEKTKSQNKSFPFVHFYRIRDERNFWNTSELKAIIPLINIADTLLKTALDNMQMCANDIIVREKKENFDYEETTNEPGAILEYPTGAARPQRLGGLVALNNFIPSIQFIQSEIQRTIRNFDSNQGKETDRVTTASGLAQLRADASQQANIKDSDRMQAWKRLYILLDWLALEFYDDDKMIYLGTPQEKERAIEENIDPKKGDIYFSFNSERLKQIKKNEEGEEIDCYYPMVDCEIKASNGFEKSKSFTLQTLQSVLSTPIDANNYKIGIMIMNLLDIEHSDEIIEMWQEKFEKPIRIPEIIQQYMSEMATQEQASLSEAFNQDPNILIGLMEQLQGQQIMDNPQGIA